MKADDRLSLEIIHRRSVIILTIIAVGAVFKLAAPVLMPLGVAIFMIALAWPVKSWLSKHLPNSLSYVGSFTAIILVLGLFFLAIWLSAAEIIETAPKYQGEIQRFWKATKYELASNGVDTSGKVKLAEVRDAFGLAVANFHETLLYLVIIITYVVLALPEVESWKMRLRTSLGKERSEKMQSTATQWGKSFQNYLVAMLIAGIISAAGTWIAAYATGLDFALSWGVLAFLMNFIPILGASLMIFPPTIFAFLQFDGTTMPLMVLLSFSTVQLIVGNIIDPKLQGNMLSMSPVVIMFSIALWGFLWGIPGALLAAPLTHGIIIACSHYDRTRWIACLLTERHRQKDPTG